MLATLIASTVFAQSGPLPRYECLEPGEKIGEGVHSDKPMPKLKCRLLTQKELAEIRAEREKEEREEKQRQAVMAELAPLVAPLVDRYIAEVLTPAFILDIETFVDRQTARSYAIANAAVDLSEGGNVDLALEVFRRVGSADEYRKLRLEERLPGLLGRFAQSLVDHGRMNDAARLDGYSSVPGLVNQAIEQRKRDIQEGNPLRKPNVRGIPLYGPPGCFRSFIVDSASNAGKEYLLADARKLVASNPRSLPSAGDQQLALRQMLRWAPCIVQDLSVAGDANGALETIAEMFDHLGRAFTDGRFMQRQPMESLGQGIVWDLRSFLSFLGWVAINGPLAK